MRISIHSLSIVLVGLAICVLPSMSRAGSPRGPDFDWDQFDDLPIGASGESIGAATYAGSIAFLYGSGSGLAEPMGYTNYLHQDILNIAETAESLDRFSEVMAWGDFDGDCYDDLVVGVNMEDVGIDTWAGAIQVIYSDSTGLTTVDEIWSRDSVNIVETADVHDHLGAAVAVGDFDNDGYDDVVIGVPGDEDPVGDGGSIHVIYGTSAGLDDADNAWFHQDSTNMNDNAEVDDAFGASLAAGDFNCDGYDDVAVGVTGEDSVGAVHIIYGGSGGIDPANGPGDEIFREGDFNILLPSGTPSQFGQTLVVGNFDDNSNGGVGCQDLAVGMPMHDNLSFADTGIVHVFYGTNASGIQFTSPNDQLWSQDTGTIQDSAEASDQFGEEMLAAEIDNDAYDDLVVGVDSESLESMNGVGAVHIIRGSASGLTDTSNAFWTQETTNVGGMNATDDFFGRGLGYGRKFDFNNSIGALAVGAPGEDHSGVGHAGLTYVIYLDNTSTPTIAYTEIWDQADIADSNEANDGFGDAFVPTRDVDYRCPMQP